MSAANIETIRQAILARRKLRIAYVDLREKQSERVIRPLGLAFWGTLWTLTAWCETRTDFRNFRLDRMHSIEPLSETFEDQPGTRLEDFLAMVNSIAAPPSGTSK
jgi:predicted DNA-binding transcriptional regulator YafY